MLFSLLSPSAKTNLGIVERYVTNDSGGAHFTVLRNAPKRSSINKLMCCECFCSIVAECLRYLRLMEKSFRLSCARKTLKVILYERYRFSPLLHLLELFQESYYKRLVQQNNARLLALNSFTLCLTRYMQGKMSSIIRCTFECTRDLETDPHEIGVLHGVYVLCVSVEMLRANL